MIINDKLIYDNLKYNLDLDIRDSVTSTNTILKTLAIAGKKEGVVVLTTHQTNGRGRMGKTFYSPKSSGVYLSLLLRPNILAKDALQITTLAAVSIANAIENVCHKNALIKWVNDIYIDDKKVCGILAESALSSDGKHLEYVVLGIGINITIPENGFPEEIADIASAICHDGPCDFSIELLISTILNNFMDGYINISSKSHVKEYIEKSCVIDKDIFVIKDKERLEATAMAIDEDCRLKVKYVDGTEEWLTYGEISTKLKRM